MPDHTLSWGSAERAEADKLLSTVAHLVAPVAKHLKIEPPSWQALRSRMKVGHSRAAAFSARLYSLGINRP